MAASSFTPTMRWRLAAIVAAVLVLSFLVTSALLIEKARRARQVEVDRVIAASRSLTQSLDRGVAGARSLLIGLSSSPLLRADDLKAYYEQLKSTSIPDGTWLVLSDREKLLLQTLVPYGTPLPRLSDFPPSPNFLENLETRGITVTGRYESILRKGTFVVTINLKIPDESGKMKYFVTTVLSDQWFRNVLAEQPIAPDVSLAVYDNRRLGIVSLTMDTIAVDPSIPAALSNELTKNADASSMEGLQDGVDANGRPVLIAYVRSDLTEWTSAASIPVAALDGPLRETIIQLSLAAVVITIAGFVAFRYLTKEVEGPINQLQTSVKEAQETVGELTQKLLRVQEDEHQRIAGELHDSTTQHLVGALLSLMSLRSKLPAGTAAMPAFDDAKISVEKALNELRTFSYLLYPRDMGKHGLAGTLRDFVKGFAQRAGLEAEVSVDQSIREMSSESQHSLLRIAQAALANVHQHANASRVRLDLAVVDGFVILTIEDDGRSDGFSGMAASDDDEEGVGLPSMRHRLIPFGGKVTVNQTAEGTTVRAEIPCSTVGL